MAKLIFTNKAVDDLSEIWDYTDRVWSESQADRYYELLLECCREISCNLGIGKPYPEISDQVLGWKAGKHIIFYKEVPGNEILIIRILHEIMDLKNRIKDK